MPRCNFLMFLGLLLVGLLGSMDLQVFQLIWKKIRAIMSLHIFWLPPTLVCLKLSHSLLLLLCVFSLVFFLNFLFWVLHYYACKFIDFSSVMSNLLLIPSSMFFISDIALFILYSIWFFFISHISTTMFNISSWFLNIWTTVIAAVLMSLSPNFTISVSPGSFSLYLFFSHWLYFLSSLHAC